MNVLMAFLMVGLGGAIGSMSRFGVGLVALKHLGPRFPYGTFFVNITGCFLIGLLFTLLTEKAVPSTSNLRFILITGFLGGYTTFSAYALETNMLANEGEWIPAAVNFIGTAVAGIIALRLGTVIARVVF